MQARSRWHRHAVCREPTVGPAEARPFDYWLRPAKSLVYNRRASLLLAVLPNGERRTNIHRVLRHDLFFMGRWLAREVNMRLILAVAQQ